MSVPSLAVVAASPGGRPFRTVAVCGLGRMGRGIAMAALRAGYDLLVHDSDPLGAEAAAAELRAETRSPGTLRLLTSPAELRPAELVIEAIPESAPLKRAWLATVEPLLRPDACIATNTSSLPLSSVSGALADPSRLCALHFCHPVAERRLVELAIGAQTAPSVRERLERFVQSLDKLPIVVADSPGFVLNRLLTIHLGESLDLLLAGFEPEALDAAARSLGLPSGPLRMLEAFGLETALAVGRTLFETFPDRFPPSELLIALCKLSRRCQGRFRLYRASASGPTAELEPAVRELIAARRRPTRSTSGPELDLRLRLALLPEATRLIESGVVSSAAAIDVVLRGGLGLDPAAPGLFEWADRQGAAAVVDWLTPLASSGARFAPTASLLAAARSGSSFLAASTQRRAA